MTLGCKLSAETLDAMTVTFTQCGFMPDALVQLDAALTGPNRYNGQPYVLESPGLVETANKTLSREGSGGHVLMNVANPGGIVYVGSSIVGFLFYLIGLLIFHGRPDTT